MFYQRGEMATVGWVRKWRRGLRRLARKIGALGLIASLFLPICSTADDFHTCALHQLSAPFHFSKMTSSIGDDQLDHSECLACQWQVLADAPLTAPPTQTILLAHRPTLSEQRDVQIFTLHSVKPKRAPPTAFFSL